MKKKIKSVEEQIADAEFVAKAEKEIGKFGADFAKMYVAMDENERYISTFLVGLMCLTNIKEEEGKTLKVILSGLFRRSPILTSLLLSQLLLIFNDVINNGKEERG